MLPALAGDAFLLFGLLALFFRFALQILFEREHDLFRQAAIIFLRRLPESLLQICWKVADVEGFVFHRVALYHHLARCQEAVYKIPRTLIWHDPAWAAAFGSRTFGYFPEYSLPAATLSVA